MWTGWPNQTFTTGYQWLNQGEPPKRDWILWQVVLWQAFPVNYLLWLQHPLGNWLSSLHQSTHQWHWLTSYATQRLYHWTNQWQIHAQHWGYSNRHPKYCAIASGATDTLPLDCKQVTIKIAAMYLTPSQGHGHTITLEPTKNLAGVSQSVTEKTKMGV